MSNEMLLLVHCYLMCIMLSVTLLQNVDLLGILVKNREVRITSVYVRSATHTHTHTQFRRGDLLEIRFANEGYRLFILSPIHSRGQNTGHISLDDL